ncbi:hypothetical protein [Thermoflavimicrobium daqui]|nr:hypothetical protein [Thermoflavimicrobium daqui]
MMKRLSIVCLFLPLLLTGCQTLFGESIPDPTDLEIEQQVLKYLPQGAKKIQPTKRRFKNKLWRVDINQDGAREGVVFFKEPMHPKQIGILIIQKKEGGKWKRVQMVEEGDFLDHVEMKNLTGNQTLELILCTVSLPKQKDKMVSVYTNPLDENKRLLLKKAFHAVSFGDLDGDELVDMVLLAQGHKQKLVASLYQGLSDQLLEFDRMSLSLEPAQVKNLIFGRLDEKRTAVFIPLSKGMQKGKLDILTLEKGKLKNLNPILSTKRSLKQKYIIGYHDINQEGIVEILAQHQAKYGEKESPLPLKDEVLIDSWIQVDKNNQVKLVSQSVTDPLFHYRFHFPKKWFDKIYLTHTEIRRELSQMDLFYHDVHFSVHPLFVLGLDVFREKDWMQAEKSYREVGTNFRVIKKTNGKVYVARLPLQTKWPKQLQRMKLAPSIEEVNQLLMTLKQK